MDSNDFCESAKSVLARPIPQSVDGLLEIEHLLQNIKLDIIADLQVRKHDSLTHAKLKMLRPKIESKLFSVRLKLIDARKEVGKKMLASLPKSASAEEYGEAVFLSLHGIPLPEGSVIRYVREKDLDHLIPLVVKNGDNKASIMIFRHMTGIRLGRTQKERLAQILSWAGVPPELHSTYSVSRR